jgi:hypothetical protein
VWGDGLGSWAPIRLVSMVVSERASGGGTRRVELQG